MLLMFVWIGTDIFGCVPIEKYVFLTILLNSSHIFIFNHFVEQES